MPCGLVSHLTKKTQQGSPKTKANSAQTLAQVRLDNLLKPFATLTQLERDEQSRNWDLQMNEAVRKYDPTTKTLLLRVCPYFRFESIVDHPWLEREPAAGIDPHKRLTIEVIRIDIDRQNTVRYQIPQRTWQDRRKLLCTANTVKPLIDSLIELKNRNILPALKSVKFALGPIIDYHGRQVATNDACKKLKKEVHDLYPAIDSHFRIDVLGS